VAGHGCDEPGVVSLLAEDFTELGYGDMDAVIKLNYCAGRPQTGAQLLARDKLAGVFKQERKDLKGLTTQAE
jgi:hypothetical protein